MKFDKWTKHIIEIIGFPFTLTNKYINRKRQYEMLKADGHLFIVDFDKNGNIASDMVHNGFEQKRLAELLAKIGYNNIQSKTFYYGEKIFMAQDASMFILDCKK
ncbi:hypothetical protein MHH70_15245 [Metasolibacillus sp. FSL H7-0170]|uniref:hypothetical protein n=1 Tax=Metasolibacillus sp. FSL H7-0170 TaxID=2921431 RepID=UPI003158CB62